MTSVGASISSEHALGGIAARPSRGGSNGW
jgi:hypothetical protein